MKWVFFKKGFTKGKAKYIFNRDVGQWVPIEFEIGLNYNDSKWHLDSIDLVKHAKEILPTSKIKKSLISSIVRKEVQ